MDKSGFTYPVNATKIFAVAPMMDWTDRHCRYFHRQLTKHALLYTEMVVADALIYGDVARHLDFSETEHPLALQLGGSDPDKLMQAAKLAEQWGYDEVNLNVGCPSDRVQSGTFGACLMRQPELVAECVHQISKAVRIPVTVKCRIGVDEQEPQQALYELAAGVFDAGCKALWVHARKAWLQGLSPKENRDIPPLDYDIVHQLKNKYVDRFIGINGGVKSVDQAAEFVSSGLNSPLDGVMVGRAAYQNPSILSHVDREFYGDNSDPVVLDDVCQNMMDYTARHLEQGGRVHHVTRHMIGLFQGQAGARRYRQILSVEAAKPQADQNIVQQAFDSVQKYAEMTELAS
ncbi:MAG: tRNA dihydrouridine(20/20a) synthase DusA [Rhizobiaceae bacterium]|nr:tRNA dihydrouridine(20/20a) synthase DusA [Rhizobiaceae bacterium]